MNLPCSFQLRLATTVPGLPTFLAEVECANEQELLATALTAQAQDIDLAAALIFLDLSRPAPESGCYLLDDETEELLAEILSSMRLGVEHFFNERLGSYDPHNNRVTPSDMGVGFPDGTLRLVWRKELALLEFDASRDLSKRAVEFLLELQELPQFCQTDDELEENDHEGVLDRRSAALFAVGFWPCDSGEFEPRTVEQVEQVLARYKRESAKIAVPA